jgi:DEAD/DEAH box helicase domain-containing protein
VACGGSASAFSASSLRHRSGRPGKMMGGKRAEAQKGSLEAGAKPPLHEHRPLRFTKADADGFCPGNGRSFAVQTGLSLGHDIVTDVAEVRPAALTSAGAAWALASALREALTRRLGVEAGEIGLAVAQRTTAVGGTTHALHFYDRAAGGAGFAPRLTEMFEELLRDVRKILACPAHCARGCSACVLASDLYAQADVLDRRAALAFVDAELAAITGPSDLDLAADGAQLARDVADEIVAWTDRDARGVILWPAAPFDPAALARPRLRTLLVRLTGAGHAVALCLDEEVLRGLDEAQRLGLRDAAVRHGLRLTTGAAPRFRHGSRAVAALADGRIWASRDEAAARFGDGWGLGQDASVVVFAGSLPAYAPFDRDQLLPKSGTAFIEVKARLDGPSRSLGDRFSALVRPYLEAVGRWRPGQLTALSYTDRYVSSPLVALLVVRVAARLAAMLGSPQHRPRFHLATAPLRAQEGAPYRLVHDWRVEADRERVLRHLCGDRLDLHLTVGPCAHSRRLTLIYADGSEATIVLDQGFGFLRLVAQPPRFEFQETAAAQAKRLGAIDVSCTSDGTTYLVVVAGG